MKNWRKRPYLRNSLHIYPDRGFVPLYRVLSESCRNGSKITNSTRTNSTRNIIPGPGFAVMFNEPCRHNGCPPTTYSPTGRLMAWVTPSLLRCWGMQASSAGSTLRIHWLLLRWETAIITGTNCSVVWWLGMLRDAAGDCIIKSRKPWRWSLFVFLSLITFLYEVYWLGSSRRGMMEAFCLWTPNVILGFPCRERWPKTSFSLHATTSMEFSSPMFNGLTHSWWFLRPAKGNRIK